MEENRDPSLRGRAARLLSRLRRENLPDTLRGLKGAWLAASCVCALLVVAALICAPLRRVRLGRRTGRRGRAAAPGVQPLVPRARHQPHPRSGGHRPAHCEGSYGSLAEKFRDDEVGSLTEAINDMSVKIGAASRAQTEFVSSVSHELRTPLTAITGWSETLLYDEALQGDSRRGIEIISNEASRLTVMVEELLEFTRLRDGRFTLNLETVDLCALIEEVDFTYSELLRHDDIQLSCSLPDEGLPPRHRRQRPPQAGAAQHTGQRRQVRPQRPPGGAHRRRGGGVCARVRARPRPGIAAEDLPHVKERFYKGRGKERGSGIGLAVCDEIVELHSGRLKIENAESGGALVTVELPVKTQ